MTIVFVIFALLILLCILDLLQAINMAKAKWFIPYLLLMPHLPLAGYLYYIAAKDGVVNSSLGLTVILIILAVCLQLYSTLRLHFQGLRKNRTKNPRVNIIYAGRNLILCGLWGMYLLAIWYIVCFMVLPVNPYDSLIKSLFAGDTELMIAAAALLVSEVVYSFVFVWLFVINGSLRIFFGSRNLVIGKRIAILLLMWVPVVQLFLAHVLCTAAKDEYLVTLGRERDETFTLEDDKCATKYPIIMVHGIGFRDLQHFNYWGRIPTLLKQHGAVLYYGHQNAWGTIEDNAEAIAGSIDRALEECGSEKVNIIAHSKGGLDSRYLISTLGYADKVATLTTINTPHRGSELITILNKLPDHIYRYIAQALGNPFKLAGEKEPDVYNSSKQLDPVFCEQFNIDNPDSEKVYYQSYTSVMKGMFSDTLLSIPYFMMRTQKCKRSDGLVNESSAVWGEFRGTLTGSRHRGVSHGDMIDLKREDIRGFDVQKVFYDIVCELKIKGF